MFCNFGALHGVVGIGGELSRPDTLGCCVDPEMWIFTGYTTVRDVDVRPPASHPTTSYSE